MQNPYRVEWVQTMVGVIIVRSVLGLYNVFRVSHFTQEVKLVPASSQENLRNSSE